MVFARIQKVTPIYTSTSTSISKFLFFKNIPNPKPFHKKFSKCRPCQKKTPNPIRSPTPEIN
jgi:hypothetical protein